MIRSLSVHQSKVNPKMHWFFCNVDMRSQASKCHSHTKHVRECPMHAETVGSVPKACSCHAHMGVNKGTAMPNQGSLSSVWPRVNWLKCVPGFIQTYLLFSMIIAIVTVPCCLLLYCSVKPKPRNSSEANFTVWLIL